LRLLATSMSIDRASLSSLNEWQTVDGLREDGLRPGGKVRVRLTTERQALRGRLESVDEWSLVIELPPAFSFVPPTEIQTSTLRRVTWAEVKRLEVRGRAVERGLAWGAALTLLMGSCGDALDNIAGGMSPKHQLVYFGAFTGIVIGYLVSLGRQWKTIFVAPSEL